MEVHGNGKGHGDISGTPMPSAIGQVSKSQIKCHLIVSSLGVNSSNKHLLSVYYVPEQCAMLTRGGLQIN